MKSPKSIVALFVLSLLATGISFAQEAKKEAPASKQAGCCAKAEKDGKACTHECCAAAAKDGNNCETCKGSGKIEKKAEKKDEKHKH
jgi:hypothetical protein